MGEGYRRLFAVLVALIAGFGATTRGGADDGGAYIASSSPTSLQAAQASSEVAPSHHPGRGCGVDDHDDELTGRHDPTAGRGDGRPDHLATPADAADLHHSRAAAHDEHDPRQLPQQH